MKTQKLKKVLTLAEQKKQLHRENLRLLRLYGRTAAEYDEMLMASGGVCDICGRPPKNNHLAVDHDHKARYIKIAVVKMDTFGTYRATAVYHGKTFTVTGAKKLVRKGVQRMLKRASVRGLLCHAGCNVGLRKFGDDPIRLHNAAVYLEKFHAQFSNHTS